jgi:hypothetical protein
MSYTLPDGVEPAISSSCGPVNLICAVKDHAPARIMALQSSMVELEAKYREMEREVLVLSRLLEAAHSESEPGS